MVLTEILQNALEHGFGQGEHRHGRGRRRCAAARASEARLLVTVQDDGCGLPEGFDPQRAGNLGLQIVRTLVEGELGGTFDMVPAPGARHAGDPGHPGARATSSTDEPRPVRGEPRPRGSGPAQQGAPDRSWSGAQMLVAVRIGGTARCGSGAGDAYSLYAPPGSGVTGLVVRRWRCAPGCERRGASSRGARPR